VTTVFVAYTCTVLARVPCWPTLSISYYSLAGQVGRKALTLGGQQAARPVMRRGQWQAGKSLPHIL